MNRIVTVALAAATALSLAGAAQGQEAKAKKEPTAGQLAARERMSKCSAEWKDAKAKGSLAKDAQWPKFWSECNKRLKGGGKA